MAQAKSGDTVKVHYNGTLEDGTVFDSSLDRDPLEFTLGKNMVIPGFETAVLGMDEGATQKVTIKPEEAYGTRRDELVGKVNRTQIPEDLEPEVGMTLQAQSPDGYVTDVVITEVEDETVTLDANHPLADKTLNFEITLVEIV